MAAKRRARTRLWPYLLGIAAGGLAVGLVLTNRHPPEKEDGPPVRFVDVTKASGIGFVHHSGVTTRKLLPETMGSGVAVIDFDNDGKPDLLFVNSRPWPGQEVKEPLPTPALYRNLGNGTFADVTREAGLAISYFGMGVAVGDFDNDGWPDLFITGVGGNRLLRNEAGDKGRVFRDVTARAGVGGPGGWPATSPDFSSFDRPLTWSTSAAWLDYDGDGLLDLFVCNYLTWSPRLDSGQNFRLRSGERAYGPPRAFAGTQCILYRNLGGGRFADVSRQTGVEVSAQQGEPGREVASACRSPATSTRTVGRTSSWPTTPYATSSSTTPPTRRAGASSARSARWPGSPTPTARRAGRWASIGGRPRHAGETPCSSATSPTSRIPSSYSSAPATMRLTDLARRRRASRVRRACR